MRAAVAVEPGVVRVVEVPEPKPGPHQALTRTLAAGVCGTDEHIITGTFYRSHFPTMLGHEPMGEVIAVGDRVRNLSIGDRLLRTAAARPGEFLGRYSSTHGAFAEYGLATDVAAARADSGDGVSGDWIPYELMQQIVPPCIDPLDVGALISLKEAMSWLDALGDVAGRDVLVLGAGPAGLTYIALAKLRGARRVVGVARREAHLVRLRTFGADAVVDSSEPDFLTRVRECFQHGTTDFIIEASGSRDLLEQSPDLLSHGGTIGVYGISDSQEVFIRYGWGRPSTPRSWSLRFHPPDEASAHRSALELVQSGHFDLARLRTHVLPFNDAEDVLATMRDESACKVVISFD